YGKRPKEISSLTVNFTFIEFDCFKIEILRASSLSFDLLISSPSIVMIPSSFAMSLLTIEINVLLPAPFGPINDVIFPFGIVNDTSSITFLLLYVLNTLFISTMIYFPLELNRLSKYHLQNLE